MVHYLSSLREEDVITFYQRTFLIFLGFYYISFFLEPVKFYNDWLNSHEPLLMLSKFQVRTAICIPQIPLKLRLFPWNLCLLSILALQIRLYWRVQECKARYTVGSRSMDVYHSLQSLGKPQGLPTLLRGRYSYSLLQQYTIKEGILLLKWEKKSMLNSVWL